MSRQWTTCEGCNRVLWVEDGPICPECKKLRQAEQPEEIIISRDELLAEIDEQKISKKDAQERKGDH